MSCRKRTVRVVVKDIEVLIQERLVDVKKSDGETIHCVVASRVPWIAGMHCKMRHYAGRLKTYVSGNSSKTKEDRT